MEMDELPSDKQDRKPGIDMNGTVSAHDILILRFDVLRYSIGVAEEASGGTPVLNSYDSGWERRHAPGNFTYPSHFATLAGFLPSPAEPHMLRSRKRPFFLFQAGTGRIPPEGSHASKEATFVWSLSNTGYETICIGGVNFLSKRNDIGRILPGYFNKSYWLPAFGCTDKNSIANQVDFAANKLERHPTDRGVFMCINFLVIHYPNCHYTEGKKKDDKELHTAALRYADGRLPHLFGAFRKRSSALVIALSGYGACYGRDSYEYHCISHEKIYTVPYKHFILRK